MSEIAATVDQRAARIRSILTTALAPASLELRNESHLHADHFEHAHHAGGAADRTGESHYRLTIASPALQGLSRVQQQRTINRLLAEEFSGGLHALAVKILS